MNWIPFFNKQDLSEFEIDPTPFESIIKQFERYLRKKTHSALVNQKTLELKMKNLNTLTVYNTNLLLNANNIAKKAVDLLKSGELLNQNKRVHQLLQDCLKGIELVQSKLPLSKRLNEQSSKYPLLSKLISTNL